MFEIEPKLKEECGIFGIYGAEEAAKFSYLGLYALQHRGQESCGIVSSDKEKFYKSIGMGKVTDFFTEEKLEKLKGDMAIGHVRYSTTGASGILNAQPIVAVSRWGNMAVAHNGNITNAYQIRKELEEEGAIFQSTSDTEILVHLVARSKKKSFLEAVEESVARMKGAFSLLIMNEDTIIALRDPWGFRPLALGFAENTYVVASETAAFFGIDAQHVRDIEPGEMLVIQNNQMKSIYPFKKEKLAQCIFELIYFAKPSSFVFSHSVYQYRLALGKQLAKEDDVEADLVMPVPDSGRIAALGYSRERNIAFDEALIRSHYIGRTFIEPTQKIRDFGVKIKFYPVRSVLKGKKVVVVDDSIIRGTTARKIIKMLREAGAKEIHFRITAAPTIAPCFFGIDFPDKNELLANRMSLDEMKDYLQVDSLKYVSYEGMFKAAGLDSNHYCSACFGGEYPIDVKDFKKDIMGCD